MTAWQPLRTQLCRRPLLADALLALLLYVGVSMLWLFRPGQSWPSPLPLGLLWTALAMTAIVLRRRATMLAVGLLTAHTLVALLVPGQLQVEAVTILVVTYTAAAWLSLRRAVLAALLLWGPSLVGGLTVLDTRQPPMQLERSYFLVFLLMAVLLCITAGRTVHHRRAYIAALEDRARDAEHSQQALTAQAVADERRRIARELHDMVAHHVSVMSVLATGSRRALSRDPAAADEALVTIEETGRTALREMRRLLDVLRTDQEPAAELGPQPGVAHLGGLVEQVREAGLPVMLNVEGDARALDPAVALTIYRIVQEALTNALKHAGSATAEVRLEIGTYWLTLDICDTGRGPQPDGGRVGHGLLGMRERVMLYGGTLRTGPRSGGGFRVSARIPVDALDGGSQ
jgi:signal transduction histidine kinase